MSQILKPVNNYFSPQATKKVDRGKFSSYYKILTHKHFYKALRNYCIATTLLPIGLIKSLSPQVVCAYSPFFFFFHFTVAFDP